MNLQRSNSDAGSSISEGASIAGGVGSSENGRVDGELAQGQQDMLDHNQNVQAAVFGVVYTLSKEKYDKNFKYSLAKMLLDFLQLFVVIVHPDFGWSIDRKVWIWKILSYLHFKNPIISKGYNFYVAVLYLITVAIVSSLVLCIWVGWSFKNDRFPYVWPIKMLRFVVSIFFMVFYVGSLSIFLVALQCNYFSKDPTVRWTISHFHKECLQMPHMVHAGVALIMGLVFIFVALVMTVADFELNPVSQSLLAASTSMVELRAMVMKTVMLVSSALIDDYPKFQVILIALSAWLLAWSFLRWQPHYNKWINHVRTALYSSLSWAGLMLLVLVLSNKHGKKQFQGTTTTTMLAGLLPAMLVGFLASYLRFEVFYTRGLKAFKGADLQKKPKDIYKFTEEQEVEILSRCCRVWIDEDTLDPEAIKLAEAVIKVGLGTFPKSPGLTILNSNLMMEVQNMYQSGHSLLQAAKKMNPNICQKFVIFVREQEHRQKAQSSSSGESAVDLVSYVEFQRNYRQLIRSHKGAMYATRNFWKQLLHHDVSFVALTKAFASIDSNQNRAEKTYRMVLERYPSSAKLMRSYGRFLEDVKNDPWSASRYYSEAEKLEEEADTAQNEAVFNVSAGAEEEGGTTMLPQVDEKNNAVVLINAMGIIQMSNKNAHKMFGYKKGEMEGKNVSILMPAPFSQRHNSFLQNYQTTGKVIVLDSLRDVVAIHKERWVFPIKLAVTKVSGAGSDALFMGVLMPAEDESSLVRCWCLTNGTVLCIDQRFTDWFGKSHADVIGKSVASLVVEQDQVAELLAAASAASEDDFATGNVSLNGVKVIHKYVQAVAANIRVCIGGTANQRLFVLQFSRVEESCSSNLMVVDQKGCITFSTSGVAAMLGYSVRDMVGKLNISSLMEAPFAQLHTKWIKDVPSKIPSNSCRASATVMAIASNGAAIPVRMGISTREEGEMVSYLVSIWKSSFEEGLDLRRIRLHIDENGLVLEASNSPANLFGFKPLTLVGKSVETFIDTVYDIKTKEKVELAALINAMMQRASEQAGVCWRVGVHPPVDACNREHLANGATAGLLEKQTKPAVLQMQIAEENDEIKTILDMFRADTLSGIVEVDREGRICKAGTSLIHQAGPLFGVSSQCMVRCPLSKFIDMGGKSVEEALLSDAPQKKGAMKSWTSTGTKLGPLKVMSGRHVDGQPLILEVQACTKDATGRRVAIKLGIKKPSKGSASSLKKSLLGEPTASDPEPARPDVVPVASELLQGRETAFLPSMDVPRQQVPQMRTGSVTFALDEDAEPEEHKAFALAHADSIFGDNSKDIIRLDSRLQIEEWMTTSIAGADVTAGVTVVPSTLGADPGMLSKSFDISGPGAADGDFDNASQVSGETSQHSESEGGNASSQMQTDFRKGKRFRKLAKLLGGRKTQEAVHRFHTQTYIVLIALLVVHMACFITFTTFIKSLHSYVYEVDAAGQANDMFHRISLNSLIIREIHQGRSAPGVYSTENLAHFLALTKSRIEAFEYNHEGIYLGFKKLRRLKNLPQAPLHDLWENPALNISVMADIDPPRYETVNMSLWQLGNSFVAAAREVMSNHNRMAIGNNSIQVYSNATADLQRNRHWYFVVNNGPNVLYDSYKTCMDGLVIRGMDQIIAVNKVNISLLVIEGCLVGILATCYIWFLMKRVANTRYSLFSVFLIVPTGFLRSLATKQIHVDEEDADESDSDAGDDVPSGEAKVIRENAGKTMGVPMDTDKKALQLDFKSRSSPDGRLQQQPLSLMQRMQGMAIRLIGQHGSLANGKRSIVRNARDIHVVTMPFAFWSILVLIVYSISYVKLAACVNPLVDSNIADRVFYRITRAIFYALFYTITEDPQQKEAARQLLAMVSERLDLTYQALVYGSPPFVDSRWTTTGTTFRSSVHAKYFFKSSGICFRNDQATCLNSSSEFFEISHNGLDPMMKRLIDECTLLSRDSASDANVTNPRLQYIWQVGNHDLYEGMNRAASRYSMDALAAFNNILSIHVLLFVLAWLLAGLFLVVIFRPFLKRTAAESRRVAELLSQLPADMDVEALVEQAVGCARGTDGEPEAPSNGKGEQHTTYGMAKTTRASFELGKGSRIMAGDASSDGGSSIGHGVG